ncbi:adhesion G protein-coupled receptor E2-like [Sycon ciliatum]|uniref:adhesion G protein-coupled receptor E2-like n=1 Tax=Sycon ciliatum TaxID=27933 RepID=UPI0031F6B7D1
MYGEASTKPIFVEYFDECSNTPGVCQHITDSICKNSPGSYRCQCNSGYTGVTCQDINECTPDTGICKSTANSHCNNTPGSYQCLCRTGYTGSTCQDIDECTHDTGVCNNIANSECNNTPGSYQCVCKSGFTGTPCKDINECNEENTCQSTKHSDCTNTIGSYGCVCKKGYSGSPCQDVNECDGNPAVCSAMMNTTCSNTNGSYQCVCIDGLTGPTCQDHDECSTSPGVCQHIPQSSCKNSPGSYRCQCNPGYTGVTCQDIDECSQHGTHNCTARLNGENRICENTNGSYWCPCASSGTAILDENCAAKQDLASTGSATLPIAVVVPVLGLALTALLIWVIVRRRRKASLNVVGQDTETREMRAYENNQLSIMPSNEKDVIKVQNGVERCEQVATHESATKEVVYSLPKKPKKPATSNGESEEGSIIRNNRADNNDGTCGLYHLATAPIGLYHLATAPIHDLHVDTVSPSTSPPMATSTEQKSGSSITGSPATASAHRGRQTEDDLELLKESDIVYEMIKQSQRASCIQSQ